MESLKELSIQSQDGFVDKIMSGAIDNDRRAHVELAEFEQQLHASEKKCKFVKKRLEYMKMVYQSVGPCGLETTVFDIPSINSSKSIIINSRGTHHVETSKNFKGVDEGDFSVRNDEQRPIHFVGINEYMSSNHSELKERGTDLTSSHDHDKYTEKISRGGVSAVRLDSVQILNDSDTINNQNNSSQPRENFLMSLRNKIHKRKADKSEGVLICISNANLAHNNLIHNGTGITKKSRKRKIRMRTTHSKSIAASKPVNIIHENKYMKKNKRQVNIMTEKLKSNSDNFHIDNICDGKKETDHPWKEVVEIYHNTAARNMSMSVASSKHQFKLDELHNSTTKVGTAIVSMVDKCEEERHSIPPGYDNEERSGQYLRGGNDRWNCDESDDDDTRRKDEKGSRAIDVKHHREHCRNPTKLRSWCCESFAKRNYEQPTISSKLKQVKRYYFTRRINLQNIPFVVGTSVTRSHNLGLNIQQVYSLMKHRQLSMPSDITPMLIQKIGMNTRPMILFDEQTKRNDYGKEKEATTAIKPMLQPDAHQVRCKDPSNSLKNYGDSIDMPAHTTQSSMLRQREEELNVDDDSKKCRSVTNNSGRIRNVLHRLHDQFEAMNDEHDKLEAEVRETNDPNKQRELEVLDKELTAKEEEISALMDVYKEILTLKQQMKLYRGKKSILCFTTNSNRYHSSKGANSAGRSVTATRLVGLLRQIQSFQQQFTAT